MIFVGLGLVLLLIILLIIIQPKCPECNGKMKNYLYDSTIGKNVYKCQKCGKEWV